MLRSLTVCLGAGTTGFEGRMLGIFWQVFAEGEVTLNDDTSSEWV